MEYDGTRYHGSQYQTNAPTVQGEIERSLRRLTGEEHRVAMAGRTDAGVHARGQVASFKTSKAMPPKTWVSALNFHLPKDISTTAAYEVDPGFDVRRHAIRREYRYRIMNRPTPSALYRGFCHFVRWPLDVDAMNEACQVLVGQHDFAPFSSIADGRPTCRRVFEAGVSRRDNWVMFDMAADSFLPHQVRNTVGGLLRVGLGKTKGETFRAMAVSGKPGVVGPTAPARGLCLMRVMYRNFPPSQMEIEER
jgi:tRNA pseudouridine38-40 synthase